MNPDEPSVLVYDVWHPGILLLGAMMLVPHQTAPKAIWAVAGSDMPTQHAANFYSMLVRRYKAGEAIDADYLLPELRHVRSPYVSIAETAASVPWAAFRAVGSIDAIIAAVRGESLATKSAEAA